MYYKVLYMTRNGHITDRGWAMGYPSLRRFSAKTVESHWTNSNNWEDLQNVEKTKSSSRRLRSVGFVHIS